MSNIINRLETTLSPYLFYWEEWISNGNCNLSENDISILKHFLNNDFELNNLDLTALYERVDIINAVIKKLEIGYPVFKDVVIVDFLTTIIAIAKTSPEGFTAFLKKPIKDLALSEDMKGNLLNFKAHTLNMLFIMFRTEEFSHGWVYNLIVEFQKIKKQELVIHLKC